MASVIGLASPPHLGLPSPLPSASSLASPRQNRRQDTVSRPCLGLRIICQPGLAAISAQEKSLPPSRQKPKLQAPRASADVAVESQANDRAAESAPPQGLLSSSLGANLDTAGGCSFRVWAPHAQEAELALIRKSGGKGNGRKSDGNGAAHLNDGGTAHPSGEPEIFGMERRGNIWSVHVANVQAGSKYWFVFSQGGRKFSRRDARARATEYDSDTCLVVEPRGYPWAHFPAPAFHELNIYQLHTGAFTGRLEGGGGFAALEEKLQYIADLGFTAIEMLPVHEYCGSWGYNPRLLFSIHPSYGTPHDLRRLVDKAHQKGLAVIFDVVLNHGAAKLNSLWAYDGWDEGGRGGIYFDGGTDTAWGRTFAWWQQEVKDMVVDAARMFLEEYNGDGLRFDCVHVMPWDLCQRLTWTLRREFPGKILISEFTPEKPEVITGAGFDATWTHSSYYDMRAFMKERRSLRKLESLLSLHPGYSKPTECIKYFMGCHDQLGCRKNGGYDDEIQGYHRYAVELYGGRDSWQARAVARMWYGCLVVCQGIPMAFMGTEWHHSQWWGVDQQHSLHWELQKDDIGRAMERLVTAGNQMRKQSRALQAGTFKTTHFNADRCVIGFVRKLESEAVLVVVNAGDSQWEQCDYRVGVGGFFQDGEKLAEVFNTQNEEFGGWKGSGNQGREVIVQDGKVAINVPKWSVLAFKSL